VAHAITTPCHASSTAAQVADGADLYGKRAIVIGRVRGSGSGIGIATARALATREVRLRSPSAADLGREIDQVGM
jgi:hypothetical protein